MLRRCRVKAMKRIQRFYVSVSAMVIIVGIGTAAIGMVGQVNQTAHAAGPPWCPNNTMDLTNPTDPCIDRVLNSMPDKRGLTTQTLLDLAKKCQSSGGGLGVHEGSCVNAVVYCYEHGSAVSECTNAALVKAMADRCNQGAGTTGGTCEPLQQANNEQFQKAYDDAIANATKNCTTA